MFIVQSQASPGTMLNGLRDIMRDGVVSARVCSAYVTLSGSRMLADCIARSAPGGKLETVEKTIVASLDFGMTEPDALRFWQDMDNSRILVAGAPHLDAGRLTTHAAFHPKLYVFGRQDGTVGSLVGSANLTSRGLTANAEVGWLERAHDRVGPVDHAWNAAIGSAVELTPEVLDRYSAARNRLPTEPRGEETESVPEPHVAGAKPMADASVDLGDYGQMWVEALSLQGGARTQLELPRGSHRFFGPAFLGYSLGHVEPIAEPSLVSGQMRWDECPVRWHGDNRMERINLPSVGKGGYEYEHSLVLFRRIEADTFELQVHPRGSDAARSLIAASQQLGLVFRVGLRSPRLTGLLDPR
ncbi:MAG: NgoFVII family restriction endonuclease [Gemmatimonadetes bacterium]|nr:NgoFVII family restriction endonuclease [Gemmatimonadota bacterium]MYC90511.1 NgoFVII family restriction endonuclease [Gemmatimonadota bacterium]